jgi:hypothetical protein
MVARVGETEVRAPVPGEVRDLPQKDGALVSAGTPLIELSADHNHVWEALRGLYLVGQPADLEDVQRFQRPMPGMPDSVQRQAVETADQIRTREAIR